MTDGVERLWGHWAEAGFLLSWVGDWLVDRSSWLGESDVKGWVFPGLLRPCSTLLFRWSWLAFGPAVKWLGCSDSSYEGDCQLDKSGVGVSTIGQRPCDLAARSCSRHRRLPLSSPLLFDFFFHCIPFHPLPWRDAVSVHEQQRQGRWRPAAEASISGATRGR
mgnify:CR=1 FL=1